MKPIIIIVGLIILWSLIGVNGETVKHFIRMSVVVVFVFLFLIPCWKFLINEGRSFIKK